MDCLFIESNFFSTQLPPSGTDNNIENCVCGTSIGAKGTTMTHRTLPCRLWNFNQQHSEEEGNVVAMLDLGRSGMCINK